MDHTNHESDLTAAYDMIIRHDRYEAALHAIYCLAAKGPVKALTLKKTREVLKTVREALGYTNDGKADGAE